jgi:electron transfer flavoprotein alpha subunit
MSVLAVMEPRDGVCTGMSLETLAAAQQIGAELGLPVYVAVFGNSAAGLTDKRLAGIFTIEHDLLDSYTPDGYTIALKQLTAKLGATLVLFPHTYRVRDFAPKLATAFGKVLISDATGFRLENGEIVLLRQVFQGKLGAELTFTGGPPNFASIQAGAWRADTAISGSAAIETFIPELKSDQIRTKPTVRFREAERAVDLSAAQIIVSVGRGIKEAENIEIVSKLAEALGAEMAASRPICDSGWMPMERQVGSSGQTVAPRIYFAIGISGAIQHLVGMKGAKTVVAINRDPNAPIFEVADYGIVGDLFQVVPALVEALRNSKG